MHCHNLNIREMKRETDFRFRISGLFFARGFTCPVNGPAVSRNYEVSLRMESEAKWCLDTINGEPQKVGFPNVAWKRPGLPVITRSPQPRDTISFQYSEETMHEFFRIGMEPKVNCAAFMMTPQIESLIRKLENLVYHLHSPGIPDQIDWIGFQLCKLLLMEQKPEREENTYETVIRNISLWLQSHYDEPVNMSELAVRNGLSHADFYVKWKKVFSVTPAQYLINLKLEAAAQRLIQTEKPISEIVREVRFSNLYTFHQRFRQKFGISPGEYRKRHSSDPVILPI